MTPLEEQVEKLARRWEKEADGGELLDEVAYALEGAADELRALLPLEVTDEMVEAGAKALGEWGGSAMPGPPLNRELSRACLSAALTQPQTERCPEDCDGFGRLIGDSDGPCPACSGLESDGGGAATAAGVADADLEAAAMEISVKATRLDPETYKVPDKLIWMLRSALFPNEDMERIKSPGPYAKAFREKFPVPEFPGIKNRQEDQA